MSVKYLTWTMSRVGKHDGIVAGCRTRLRAGLAFTSSEVARIISESEGERIGIACGTRFDDAGAVRIGIHESLIV
jgi:hypothetical protein